MKKILFFVALAGIMISSCGNKAKQNNNELDSTEQVILSDSVVAQLDSMANIMSEAADSSDLSKIFSKEKAKLSPNLEKLKPDYLITEEDINDLKDIQQKYVALAYLCVDNSIDQLYSTGRTDFYNNCMGHLAIETAIVNKDAADAAKDAPLTINNVKKFYKDMKDRNCLNQFYIAQAAYLVEILYVLSRNADIYMPFVNDQTAASLSKRLATVVSGCDLIAKSHPEMKPAADALSTIKGINATTSAQLKEQIEKAHEALAKARKDLIEA